MPCSLVAVVGATSLQCRSYSSFLILLPGLPSLLWCSSCLMCLGVLQVRCGAAAWSCIHTLVHTVICIGHYCNGCQASRWNEVAGASRQSVLLCCLLYIQSCSACVTVTAFLLHVPHVLGSCRAFLGRGALCAAAAVTWCRCRPAVAAAFTMVGWLGLFCLAVIAVICLIPLSALQ